MRETLYIRYLSAHDASAVEYAAAADADVSRLDVQVADVETALDLAAGRRLIVFVPATDVRFTTVAVPAKQAAKVLQAVPFALEDLVADDVEELHFAIGPRQAGGAYPVAIVSRERMDAWMAPLRARGVRADLVVPEALALPVDPEARRWSALADGGGAIVRNGPWSGFACAEDELGAWLDLADPERTQTVRLLLTSHATDFSTLERPVELLPGFASGLAALASQLRPEAAINLLQGVHAQGRDVNRLWKPWRLAAALGIAWILAGLVAFAVDTWRLDREVARQDAANAARFQSLFPAETRVVDLDAQLDQQLRLLAANSGGGGILPLLEVTAQAIAASKGLKLSGLQYRDHDLFLSMTGPSLESLDALRNWFAGEARGAALEVQSANQEGGVVQIRVKVSAT